MTTPISSSTNTLAGAASKAGGTTAAAQGEKFLTLLIAQMKNQDPMNPMDNGQMTSQLAALETVAGVEKLNASVASLSSSLLSGQIGQGAALLNKDVIAEGSGFSVENGAGFAGFELTEPADNVSVDILDSRGISVKNINLVNVAPGATPLRMSDYGIPDGKYTIKVTAQAEGKNLEDVTTVVQTRVKNLIPSSDSSYQLGLANGTVIGMNQIRLVQSA